MPANECTVNRIMDTLEALFLTIGKGDNPDQWYTAPQTVLSYVPDSWEGLTLPAIMFEVSRVGAFSPQASYYGERTCDVDVYLCPSTEGGPEDVRREMHRMAADVLNATIDDFQLTTGNEDDPVLVTGHVFDDGYEAAMSVGNKAVDRSAVKLTLRCSWLSEAFGA